MIVVDVGVYDADAQAATASRKPLVVPIHEAATGAVIIAARNGIAHRVDEFGANRRHRCRLARAGRHKSIYVVGRKLIR